MSDNLHAINTSIRPALVMPALRMAVLAAAIVAACLPPAGATSVVQLDLDAPPSPEDMKVAREDFRTLCSGCHGDNAKGRGPIAIELKTKPADLTLIAQRAGGTFDRQAVYKTVEGLDMPLAHGSSEMPVWGAWFVQQAIGEGVLLEDARSAANVAQKRISNLVKYLETLQQ